MRSQGIAPHPWRILLVLASINLVSYATRNALFAVVPDLEHRFGVGDADVGLLQTVFMIPHACATLPFGWAGDRFDRRRVIALGLAFGSLACAVSAATSSFTTLAITRGVVGFGTAAVVPVANSIIGQIFDGPHKASRLSIFNLGLFLGGVVGFGTGIAFGFPVVVIVLAIPGIVLSAALVALWVPPHPAPHPGHLGDFLRELAAEGKALLRIRTLRWVMLSTTFMAFAAGGYTAWLNEFLMREKGMSKASAGTLLGLALVGGLSGILVGGRVADWLRTRFAAGRLWTIVAGMTLTIPCAVCAIELPAGPMLYVAGVATMFFISWYHAPMAASVDDLAPAASAVGAQGLVIFTMHLFGTSPASWVVGLVSQYSSLWVGMWVPTISLVIAALAMLAATPSFAADHVRARGGTRAPASL
jgi:predicted MFS family arabinose efflux permease